MTLLTMRRTISTTSRAKNLSLGSSRSPLHARSAVAKFQPNHVLQARMLWWWSRHGGEWATQDSDLEERMQQYQRIMKHRYSKALRRRAMWDWDGGKNGSPWDLRLPSRWMGSRWADYKNLSSSPHVRADVRGEEPEKVPRSKKEADEWSEWSKDWHMDFDKFKTSIDKAIEKDPIGTLFGRHMRLRSPPTNNNSSWTSWSWIFEPGKVAENATEKAKPSEDSTDTQSAGGSQQHVQASSVEPHTKPASNIRATFSVKPRSNPVVANKHTANLDTEYDYDPISGRKVPRMQQARVEEAPATKKPFLATLFSEHGVDIPVKTYKPHKVYGFGGTEPPKGNTSQKPADMKQKSPAKSFESSRLQEIKNMKASILGNSIDTTAEFYGKYKSEDDVAPPSDSDKKQLEARLDKSEDNAPLFSGTTYESRSDQILGSDVNNKPSSKVLRNSWLLKEGFQTLDEALQKPTVAPSAPVTIEKPTSTKIEPALDRMRTTTSPPARPLEKSFENVGMNEKAEDVDLLRASDVRAASKTARKTKQELNQVKQDAREKLEADYRFGNENPNEIRDVFPDHFSDTTAKISKSLNNVWKHVREYPQGIVAKTMQSMGLFNDNYKNYIRVDKPTTDLTEKLVFKDETLSKTPSIYKKISRSTNKQMDFTPNQEVLRAEKEGQARTEALQRANEEVARTQAVEQVQASDLAKEIRSAYESRYGVIDEHHRQPSETPSSGESPSNVVEEEAPKKPHPLMTASVKPGVAQDPSIEYHINNFEPQYAKLVDGVRDVRRGLHEASSQVKALKSRRPATYWNARSVDEAKQTSARSSDFAEVASPERQQDTAGVTAPSDVPVSVKSQGVVLESTPQRTVEAAIDSKESLPTYVFLAYNPATGQVDKSPMSSRLFRNSSDNQMQDLAQVLTNLSHAALFMPHLERLQTEGYELLRGGADSLVLKSATTDQGSITGIESLKPNSDEGLQVLPPTPCAVEESATHKADVIAAEEAAAQPYTAPITSAPSKEAATVLDEIPPQVEPAPGPAAPTAPPTSPIASSPNSSTNSPAEELKSRVMKRQESVFSGQNLNSISSSDGYPPTETVKDSEMPKLTDDISDLSVDRLQTLSNTVVDYRFTPNRSDRRAWRKKIKAAIGAKLQEEQGRHQRQDSSGQQARPGWFARFRRGIKRVILTGTVIGGAAYGIGVLFENGAQIEQRQKTAYAAAAVGGGDGNEVIVNGKRYSVGTRPGIYSTESSR